MNTNTDTNANPNTVNLNEQSITKLLNVVDAGLISGLENPTPGKMSVEAAVCYAFGLPHDNKPICVDEVVRQFKVNLNDARWKSNASRAKGLRRLAVAQLNSKGSINQEVFVKRLVEETNKRVLVPLLRELGHNEQAEVCERASTLNEIEIAATYTARAADAATYTAYAAGAAADAVYAATYAVYAADAAYAALAAIYTARAADAAARAVNTNGEKYLLAAADAALDVLIELKSPGVDYLYLCDNNGKEVRHDATSE